MSRLREKGMQAALSTLIAALFSMSMGLPLLKCCGFSNQLLRFVCWTAAFSAVFALLRTRKWLLPLALVLFAAASAVHFALGGGWISDAKNVIDAVKMYISGTKTAVLLYSDVIVLHLALYFALIGIILADPDSIVFMQIFSLGMVLCMIRMLVGSGAGIYMLPALPAILLLFAWSHAMEPAGDTPPRKTMPAAALAAAGVLCGLAVLIAPSADTTVPVLETFADNLREMAEDALRLNEERTHYSLSLDGWMPQGEDHLGGEPTIENRAVMQVQADETVYLRGAIKDTYNGSAWYDTIGAQRCSWSSKRYQTLRNQVFQTDYPLISAQNEKNVTVTMLGANTGTLFVPQRLRSLSVDDGSKIYFTRSSETFLHRDLQAGDSYAASYLSMKATDPGMAALVAGNENAQDDAYADALAQYTAVPSHMQQEIYDIADQATQGCSTPWEKAVALRDYLKDNYPYTLQVQTPPTDVDFIAWFLLAERQGYCTYFASAMTILCRMAGLPARYVEGYYVDAGNGGLITVTSMNAHAWTEVYFQGVGWVTFDATPNIDEADQSDLPDASLPPDEQNQPTATPTPTVTPTPSVNPSPDAQPTETPTPAPDGNAPTPTPGPTPSPTPDVTPPPQDPPENSEGHFPWLLFLLLLAVLLLLARRIRTTDPIYRADREKNSTAALLLLWHAILQSMAMLGKPRQGTETVLDYGKRIENSTDIPLERLAEDVSTAQYSRHAPPKQTITFAKRVYTDLQTKMTPWQRLWLCLRRIVRIGKVK